MFVFKCRINKKINYVEDLRCLSIEYETLSKFKKIVSQIQYKKKKRKEKKETVLFLISCFFVMQSYVTACSRYDNNVMTS